MRKLSWCIFILGCFGLVAGVVHLLYTLAVGYMCYYLTNAEFSDFINRFQGEYTMYIPILFIFILGASGIYYTQEK